MFSYWAKPEHTLDLSRFLNDDIAQTCSENPKRFVGLGKALAMIYFNFKNSTLIDFIFFFVH